ERFPQFVYEEFPIEERLPRERLPANRGQERCLARSRLCGIPVRRRCRCALHLADSHQAAWSVVPLDQKDLASETDVGRVSGAPGEIAKALFLDRIQVFLELGKWICTRVPHEQV